MFKAYELSLNLRLESENILLKMIENIGIISKNIMMKENYYFKSRINDPKYLVSDDIMMECFAKHIGYILKIANDEGINLNIVSKSSREIDRKYFLIIEKNENKK